jgi:hypothetical protein
MVVGLEDMARNLRHTQPTNNHFARTSKEARENPTVEAE